MHNTKEVALKLKTFSVVYSLNYSPRTAHDCGPGSNFKRMKVDRSFQITENHLLLFLQSRNFYDMIQFVIST